MGVSYRQAEEMVEAAAAELFDADSRARSVGITQHNECYGYRAVRNSALIVPQALGQALPQNFEGIPISFVESLVAVPASGPASPAAASLIPEVNRNRPLVSGLQIQNFDDDDRQGILNRGFIIVGTLGCLVRLPNGNQDSFQTIMSLPARIGGSGAPTGFSNTGTALSCSTIRSAF